MFIIDVQSKDPIFEQIKKQIVRFIEIGALKPDDKLPSIRSLAIKLGINPNTVSKAYQELENEGIVYTLIKKGVFVSNKENIYKLNKMNYFSNFKKFTTECKRIGITKNELDIILKEIYGG